MFNISPFLSSVTVQCTKGGLFVVVIAKDATLPHVDFDSVSWLGSGNDCGVVDRNSEFSIYNFAVTDCGTIVRVGVQFPCFTKINK